MARSGFSPRLLFASIATLAVACASSSLQPPAPRGPGTWTTATPLNEPRFEAYAAAARGRIYFLGGIAGSGDSPATAFTSACMNPTHAILASQEEVPKVRERVAVTRSRLRPRM